MRFVFWFILFALTLSPNVLAIGIGPGTITLEYVPGTTETIEMIALNDIDQQSMFSISASSNFVTCTPGELQMAPMSRESFTCSVRIEKWDLPPGVQEIARIRLSEVAPVGIGVGAVGAVVSIVRVKVPNEGPYLSASLDVQNVAQGQRTSGKLSLANGGTEPIDQVHSSISVVNAAGGSMLSIPPFTIGPFAIGESKDYPVTLPTEQLKSGNYRAMIDVPYNGKSAHAEGWFKIGEKRIDVKGFSADPIAPGGIIRAQLETESFWSEDLQYYIDFIILQKGQEIGSVRNRFENLAAWGSQVTALYWESGSTPPGVYDVRIILKYAGKEERKEFPGAITINAPPEPPRRAMWRKPALIGIGVLIVLLAIVLVVVLRRKHEQQ